MRVVVFDPGVSPDGVVFDGLHRPVFIESCGVERRMSDGRKRMDPDRIRIREALREWKPDIVGVEQVGAMGSKRNPDGSPGAAQGLASTSRLTHACGLLEGIAFGLGHRVVMIHPKTWRSKFRLPPGKEQSRLAAVRIYPYLASEFKLVKSHNKSDCLLMAVYLWHTEQGLPIPQ